jgi:hypothetical protein
MVVSFHGGSPFSSFVPDSIQNQGEPPPQLATTAGTPSKPSTPTCCKTAKELAEQFAIAARLYAEAVALFTSHKGTLSHAEYNRLVRTVEGAQQRSEAIGVAYEEHMALHRREDQAQATGT